MKSVAAGLIALMAIFAIGYPAMAQTADRITVGTSSFTSVTPMGTPPVFHPWLPS